MEIPCPARAVRGFGESQLEAYFAKHVTQTTVAGNRPEIGFLANPNQEVKMTYAALPAATRSKSVSLGVVALIALGLLSVVSGVRHPEAITAEYQGASMVVP
jgi:hypothetical protein